MVSVLFCDLVGFTDFSDGADPEDVDLLLESYFARARDAIETHGGVVEKFIGDAVVGVFGHPNAHDDDPERAVRAGLAIVAATAGAEGHDGPWLPVRVGVNTGEALLRRGIDPGSGEGFLAGDSVNVAARIQHEAEPMSVLVGPDTHAVTAAVFDYQERAPVELRGKAEPVVLFQPLAALALVGTDLTRRHDAPFVGRTDELADLTVAWERVVSGWSALLVRVVGEPGIGKSRLVGQFLDRVQAQVPGLVWRTGRCLPYGEQAGIWALGEIVRDHLGVTDTDPVEEAAAKLDAALPVGPDRGWLRERLLPLLGIHASQSGSAAEQLAAWSRFLRDTVAAGPSMLVFEDVHWADDTLLRFVHQLVNDATDQPLMVIVTTRPEHRLDSVVEHLTDDEEEQHEDDRPQPAATQVALALSPLDAAASRTLLSALLAHPSVPDDLAATVTARANGNPLFLGELVRLLRDRELIAVDDHGAWQLTTDAQIPVPDSLHGVIAARYDLLPDTTRTLLATASVLGRTFWPAAVEAMRPHCAPTLVADLGLATERDLITLVPSTMTRHAEYAFFHALTRDVIYGTVTRDARAADHTAAAAWLEGELGDRVDEIVDVLAHHYTSALDLHSATGHVEQAEALKPRAVHYLYATAKRVKTTDNLASLDLFRRAVDLAGPELSERVQLLCDYSIALRDDSQFTEAIDIASQAVDEGRRRTDELELARAELALLETASIDPAVVPFDVSVRMQEWFDRTLRLPTNEMTPIALAGRANHAYWVEGQTEAALADVHRAVEVAGQIGLGACEALVKRGTYRLHAGDPVGLDDIRRAIDVGRQTGDSRAMCMAYLNLTFGVRFAGPVPLLPLMEEGARVSAERGYRQWSLAIAGELFDTQLLAGKVTAAMDLVDHVRAPLYGDSVREVLDAAISLARLAELTGDEELRRDIADHLGRFDYVDLARSTNRTVYGQLGLVAAAAAKDRTTFAAVLPLLRDNPQLCDGPHWVPYLGSLVRMALQLSDPDIATQLITNATYTCPMLDHTVVHARAMIHEHTGDLEEAASRYVEAAHRWEQFTNVREQGDALIGAGRCFAAVDDNESARSLLFKARGLYEAMPAPGKVDQCQALLTALE